MKRSYAVAATFVSFLLCGSVIALSAGETEPAKRAFSLVIRGGAGSLGIGDLNTTLASIDAAYDSGRDVNPNYTFGHVREVSGRFKDWELEVRWTVWKGLSVGAALSGPVHLRGYGNISYMYTWTQSYTIESEVRMASPIKLNLYYSIPVHSKVNLILNGGAGLYHARMSQNYDWQRRHHDLTEEGNYDVGGNYHFDVSGRAVGCHFGVALEYKVNDRFSMMAEGQWTFAKIKSLKGSCEYASVTSYVYGGGDIISSESYSYEGDLYHYINTYGYETLGVNSDPDNLAEMSEVRKATLDLGGLTVKIGLKIGLF